ncbi:MAG: type I-MYXAN CRISPR-associated protein Cas5/Cmx5/DevS [Planctomycetaceae bacterium]
MLGLYVSVPITCFRKGLAREYLETESLPPPSTCYGFLLSLVGEMDRIRHIGCRIAPMLLDRPEQSVVLRTVWRVKKTPLGSSGNTRPDYQQLLTDVQLIIWLDSSDELEAPSLEDRVRVALTQPDQVQRFGGLSLGESTHLVNDVSLLDEDRIEQFPTAAAELYVLHPEGNMTLPVWVDHVGSAGTRYVTGRLEPSGITPPPTERMPQITDK